ncbi:hypothetical protein ABIC83_002625 [Roseateles asaccharophilus]|uniref:hemerythrin domain-containing protein n=1 Tax=Roseateles asaccharophilus TaxID=582607 RepID=UPI003832A9F3
MSTTNTDHPLASTSLAGRQADAFGPVTLTAFASNPNGSHVFRAQHAHLTRLMAGVLAAAEAGLDGERAVVIREGLTSLSTLLQLHQSLEDGLVHRALSAEPRSRMMAETFEREMAPLVAEVASLSRRFPTPSSIMASSKGEFATLCGNLFTRLKERFGREERDIFSAYDRILGAGTSTQASAA